MTQQTPREIIAGNLPTYADLYKQPREIELPTIWRVQEDADNIIRALTAAGYAIVPKEPTWRMVLIGERAGMAYIADARADMTIKDARPSITAEIYRAMIADSLGEQVMDAKETK